MLAVLRHDQRAADLAGGNGDRAPAVGELAQPPTAGELVQLPAQRLQLALHLDRQAQRPADSLTFTGPAASRTIVRIRW
jgi:hypothetical protein